MSDHEIDALARAARRKRRLPPDAACATCATTDQLSRRPDGRVLCYAHLREEAGARPFEVDHPAGVANLPGFTIRLSPNAHRTVTEWRTALGIDDLPDAEGDPLLMAAYLLVGVATLVLLVAIWLVDAALDITDHAGPGAWKGVRPTPLVP